MRRAEEKRALQLKQKVRKAKDEEAKVYNFSDIFAYFNCDNYELLKVFIKQVNQMEKDNRRIVSISWDISGLDERKLKLLQQKPIIYLPLADIFW